MVNCQSMSLNSMSEVRSPPFQGGDVAEGCEAPDATGVVTHCDQSATSKQHTLLIYDANKSHR